MTRFMWSLTNKEEKLCNWFEYVDLDCKYQFSDVYNVAYCDVGKIVRLSVISNFYLICVVL